ncbi:hypothetical protein WHR41_00581 [Cladosporium halotolerans]|uniref:Thioredoxin domain-containing protein n=1 Tax=Cladosporium halotolerans TaxID=1052096 RepID=A0AB34L564_9PEZI
MSAHIQLNSREEFDKAIQEKGKYVFIYCYEGETSPQAEEYAKKFSSTTTSYKVDISQQENARKYFGISKAPSAIVYRDGKELKKTEGMDPAVMKEIMEMLQSA